MVDWFVGLLVAWLLDCLIAWLRDGLVAWLLGWLVCWLVGWLLGWLVGWFAWLVGWLVRAFRQAPLWAIRCESLFVCLLVCVLPGLVAIERFRGCQGLGWLACFVCCLFVVCVNQRMSDELLDMSLQLQWQLGELGR